MKVVINKCYGGFSLSDKAIREYLRRRGLEFTFDGEDFYVNGRYFSYHDISRNDETLVQIVKDLGGEANTGFSELKIVEIPDDVDFVIDEYDGVEWIAEKHRTWS